MLSRKPFLRHIWDDAGLANARRVRVMETNRRIEGIGHQVKGAVMESLGVAIGDAKLAADGTAERARGDALNAAGIGGDQLIGVDTDRIMGIGHQFKGALLREIGRMIGNLKLQADGVAEREAGKEQNLAGGDRDLARQTFARQHAAVQTGPQADPPDDRPKP
jgi:uncharacterized protein YjbJ (UPF0337 family)